MIPKSDVPVKEATENQTNTIDIEAGGTINTAESTQEASNDQDGSQSEESPPKREQGQQPRTDEAKAVDTTDPTEQGKTDLDNSPSQNETRPEQPRPNPDPGCTDKCKRPKSPKKRKKKKKNRKHT